MQTLQLPSQDYDNVQGFNDLENIEEMTDNLFKRRRKKKVKKIKKRGTKKAARKIKRSTKKAKRVTKRAKKATKKGKTKRATRLQKKATKVVKKGTKKAKRVIKRKTKKAKKVETKGTLGERAIVAPLLPLRGMMVKTLNQRGVKCSKKTPMVQLTDLFYNNVVKKSSKKYEEIDYIGTFVPGDEHAAVALTAIVSGIIEFVKGVRNKKKKGEKLTKVEETVATGTEIAETKLKEKAKEEAASEVGKKLLFDKKTQLIIGGVIVVIIVIAVVLARKSK